MAELNSQALVQLVESERARVARGRANAALFQGATIFGFACLAYGVCWTYRIFSDANISIMRAMGEAAPANFVVSVALLEPEAEEVLVAHWKAEQKTGYRGTVGRGWMNKRTQFRARLEKVSVDGVFNGYTRGYNFLKGCEKILVDEGYMGPEDASEEAHPVDRAVNGLLESKWYWGGAIVLALVPGALETVRVVKGLRLHGKED